jgi:hypothetical protein
LIEIISTQSTDFPKIKERKDKMRENSPGRGARVLPADKVSVISKPLETVGTTILIGVVHSTPVIGPP